MAGGAGKRIGNERTIMMNDDGQAVETRHVSRGLRAACAFQRQANAKCRASALLAFDLDPPTHRIDEAACDRKAEPRSLETTRMSFLALRKFLEDALQRLRAHAYARILDFEDDAFLTRRREKAQSNAALFSELDRIACKVEQDLANARFVAFQRAGDGRRNLGDDLQFLFIGARRQQLRHAFERRGGIEGRRVKRDLARLDLRIVENVVDDGEQRFAGTPDRVRIGALRGIEFRGKQEIRHADDTVHGRADLVAHGGEEKALCAACRLRLVQRFGKALLHFLAVVDVAADHLYFRERAIFVADRGFLPDEPAVAEGGDDLLVVAHALLPRIARSGQRTQQARALAFRQVRHEGASDGCRPCEAKGLAEDVVHIGDAAFQILADDDVALRAHEIAITRLTFGQFPVFITQLLDTGFEFLYMTRIPARARRGTSPGFGSQQQHDGYCEQQQHHVIERGKRHRAPGLNCGINRNAAGACAKQAFNPVSIDG